MEASKALIEANRRICKEQRQKALDRYYEDPNRCKQCGGVIQVGDNERPSQVRRKIFCGHSCAATYNNIKHQKRIGSPSGPCEQCGKDFQYKKYKTGGYQKTKFCSDCIGNIQQQRMRDRHKANGTALPKDIGNMTKGELKVFYGGPAYKTKNAIGKHAKRLYDRSDKPKSCFLCGYSKLYVVAHIKAVAKFDDSVLVSEINSLDNLIALCPNHHEEYDKGLLDEEDRLKIAVVAQSGKSKRLPTSRPS
jgi:hypothetical protein